MLDLSADQRRHAGPEVGRRHQELAVAGHAGVAGEAVEHVAGVGAELLVARHQTQIRVKTRGDRVVVAGADVHVAADALALAAHHQGELGVCLEPDEAVHHVGAGRLEGLGPFDVALLVEARLELDQDRDLFPVVGSVQKRLHDGCVAPYAIERPLHGQHVRVAGRLAGQLQHGAERVVGMVQEDVVTAHHGEHVRLGAVLELHRHGRHETGVLEVWTV